MDMAQLQESIRGLRAPNYGKVKRSGLTHSVTTQWAREVITEKLKVYREIEILDQRARLIRDEIEYALRRQNEYCFKDLRQTHYRDASIKPHEKKGLIFEHMIPIRLLVAGLIQGTVPLEVALAPPTCLIRAASDQLLRDAKVHDTIEDAWNFWSRYEILNNIQFVTVRKDPVDVKTWDLGTHCTYFNVDLSNA